MRLQDLIQNLAAPVGINLEELAGRVKRSGRMLVVLDDDPTGTQSVAQLPVLGSWEQPDFEWAFDQEAPAVYVLTNTRSMSPDSAERVNREVVRNATAVARATNTLVSFVSRGDSTLRGHFPLEPDVLTDEIVQSGGRRPDALLIVPAFPDAGRITLDGVHYYVTGNTATPVAETEFAQDATFGYSNSNLARWVEEKTGGVVRAEDVVTLDLATIRCGAEAVADVLRPLRDTAPVVVDVLVEDDMRVLAMALEQLESESMSFLYRVGPPFVRARIGQEEPTPLTSADVFTGLDAPSRGGLVVVGSHVALTTRQLDALTSQQPQVQRFTIDVQAVLDPIRRDTHLEQVSRNITDALPHGSVVVNTSRILQRGTDAQDSLRIARNVSDAVVDIVQRVLVACPPRFVIAKGGITSSEVATKGLRIRHAIVRGPMLPGIVSLWEPVDGPARGIPYIVFAGNVGTDDSLAQVHTILSTH